MLLWKRSSMGVLHVIWNEKTAHWQPRVTIKSQGWKAMSTQKYPKEPTSNQLGWLDLQIITILYYYNDCTNCQGKNLYIYEWNSLSPLVHSYPTGTTRISRSKISNSQSRLLTVHRAKIKIWSEWNFNNWLKFLWISNK